VSAIRFNDRVLVLGSSQSGKSELLNLLFSQMRGGAQRVLVDTKGEFAIAGVEAASDVEAIDWSAPIVHYQPSVGDMGEMQDLFAAVFARRRIVAFVHEASDVCDFSAGKTPPAFNAICSKGAALGVGLYCGSQRPFEIPSRAKSEPLHVYIFAPRFLLEQDLKAAALTIGRDWRELGTMLDEVQATLGDHAFLHFDRRDGLLEACQPLSEAERHGIIVTRPVLY
jgi:energy-coupling factor transporter ATP-binding protein EcfA2